MSYSLASAHVFSALNIKFMWDPRSKKLILDSWCFKDWCPPRGGTISGGFSPAFARILELERVTNSNPLCGRPVFSKRWTHVLKIQKCSISSCLRRGKGRYKKWEDSSQHHCESNQYIINTGLSQRWANNLIEMINSLGLIRETFWNNFQIDK